MLFIYSSFYFNLPDDKYIKITSPKMFIVFRVHNRIRIVGAIRIFLRFI